MQLIKLGATVLASLGFALIAAAPAQAQATRTWVSGVGDDVNPCSRTAPCKTFAGAISKTATNGEINCIDPGGFGSVTITKSISIVCDQVEGGILSAGTSAFIVNAPVGSNVTLAGIDVECAATGLHGINILGTGVSVHVQKMKIRNCRGGQNAITIAPTAGVTDLYVVDSYITGNGNSSTTGGINARPTGSGNVNLTINRTMLENNSNGIRADSSATTGFIRGIVRDSSISGSAFNGIAAITTASVTSLIVDRMAIINNGTGLSTSGAQASLFVANTSVTANDAGISAPTGAIFTYRNNSVNGNIVSDGTFTAPITPQ